jgi:hypothetical protein
VGNAIVYVTCALHLAIMDIFLSGYKRKDTDNEHVQAEEWHREVKLSL